LLFWSLAAALLMDVFTRDNLFVGGSYWGTGSNLTNRNLHTILAPTQDYTVRFVVQCLINRTFNDALQWIGIYWLSKFKIFGNFRVNQKLSSFLKLSDLYTVLSVL
jgi:hypothetical protein